jgi:hypothetical protein
MVPALAVAPVVNSRMPMVNAEHLTKLTNAKQLILSHPVFAGVDVALPPTMAAGGTMAPFTDADFTASIAAGGAGAYSGAFNIWFLDPNYTPVQGVAINQKEVETLGNHSFATPPPSFPFQVICGCLSCASPADMRGHAKVLSPMEPLDAFFLRVAEDIQNNADEAVLDGWKRCMLQVMVTFHRVDTPDAMLWKSINLRENIVQQASSIARKPYQRVMELISIKRAYENTNAVTLDAETIAQLYSHEVKFAGQSEAVSVTFARAALVVWDRLLADDVLRAMIIAVEENLTGKSPFDSVYKLEAIVSKGRGPDGTRWLVTGLADLVEDGMATPGELSVRNLTGKSMGNKGVLDVLMYKMELGSHIAHRWMTSKGFDLNSVVVVTNFIGSHLAYRALFGFSVGESMDMTWMGSHHVSSQELMRLAEASCESSECIQHVGPRILYKTSSANN